MDWFQHDEPCGNRKEDGVLCCSYYSVAGLCNAPGCGVVRVKKEAPAYTFRGKSIARQWDKKQHKYKPLER